MKKLSLILFAAFISTNLLAKGYFTIENGVIHMMDENLTHKIKDFSTDGCSSFPDGLIPTQSTEWLDCCIIHDIDYWVGGEYYLKKIADENLGYCVSNKAHPLLGIAMDFGVYIGGAPSPMPWRWGYGWDFKIEYNDLDDQQLISVTSKFDSIIKAIESERSLLTNDQRINIVNKLYEKLHEFRGYLKGDEKAQRDEYERLSSLISNLLD